MGLARDIAERLHRHHPEAKALISAWWFDDAEMKMMASALKKKPDWVS